MQLIDGHLRQSLAGDTPLPVLVLDVTEEEAEEILLTYDPIGSLAERNNEALAGILKDSQERGNSLAATVWPSYIIDPLVTANWQPPKVEDMPEPDSTHRVNFTAEQWEVVKAAIVEYRRQEEMDDRLSDAQCLELICQKILQ